MDNNDDSQEEDNTQGDEPLDDELDLEVVMFHLQQSAEKLLKSVLAFNKQHLLKTHDIKNLIFACNESQIDLIDNIISLIPLTDYAVEGRYAIIHDDLDDTDKYIVILDELVVKNPGLPLVLQYLPIKVAFVFAPS